MAQSMLVSLLLLLLWVVDVVTASEHGLVDLAEDPSTQGKAVSSYSSLEDQHGLLSNVTDWEIIPHAGLESEFLNSSRRRLGSFQICALCTCCGGLRRFCIPTACCYTITCGSPNRPFGLCSFMPMSCNCLNCRL